MRFRASGCGGVATWQLRCAERRGMGCRCAAVLKADAAVCGCCSEAVRGVAGAYGGGELYQGTTSSRRRRRGTLSSMSLWRASTPAGPFTMRNLIVKFPSAGPSKKDGIIVLASHYETNFPLKDINFVGANDGACTSALLIALGAVLSRTPAYGVLGVAGFYGWRRGDRELECERLPVWQPTPGGEVVVAMVRWGR